MHAITIQHDNWSAAGAILRYELSNINNSILESNSTRACGKVLATPNSVLRQDKYLRDMRIERPIIVVQRQR